MNPSVPETFTVVDTDAFSHLFVAASSPRLRDLRDRLTGRIPVLATQSRAELLAWPRLGRWGERRSRDLAERLDATPTMPVTADVVAAYVELTVACQQNGHALHQKIHTGDRWVAATAIALNRPLLSLDSVFDGAPGLQLA